jgi:arylsulfatase A-like enzyme
MKDQAATERPNILLVTSDQHRADTLGCAGHPCVQTPHLDQLAYQGIRFDNAYVDCPVCIPARTTLITGRRAHENGKAEYAGKWRLQRPREAFLGSLLTAAGYQTELVGKTHWHTEPSFRAGFEHVTWLSELKRQQLIETGRAGTQVGLGYNEAHPTLSATPRHLHSTDWCVDRANDFLATRERDQPFALWVSMLDPHPPLTIHEPYHSMYRDADIPDAAVPGWVGSEAEPLEHFCQRHAWNKGPMTAAQVREARAVYYGMVTNLDHQLGRLIGQLQAAGDWDNTLVIYSSDHGEALGDLGTFGKRSFFECSARVPLIVRPPASWGSTPGRVSRDLVEWCDLLPTLTEAAHASTPDDVTGRSWMSALRDGDEHGGAAEADRWLPDHVMHGQIGGAHMLHDGRFKYLYWVADGSEMCFDTRDDPHDRRPIEGEPLRRLRERLTQHLRDENHEHLTPGGELLNQTLPRPSVAALRAQDVAGLGATQYLGQITRSVLDIH